MKSIIQRTNETINVIRNAPGLNPAVRGHIGALILGQAQNIGIALPQAQQAMTMGVGQLAIAFSGAMLKANTPGLSICKSRVRAYKRGISTCGLGSQVCKRVRQACGRGMRTCKGNRQPCEPGMQVC